MMCSDVRKLLPDLALGDLDAEPAAEIAAHLQGCAACRSESGAIARTLNVLRAAPSAAPSTERRSAAAAAMARAHAEQSERLLIRRPRSWAPWATQRHAALSRDALVATRPIVVFPANAGVGSGTTTGCASSPTWRTEP